jgi:hypothetical protein
MFSLGWEMDPLSWSGLSLAVGLSIANSLDPQKTRGLGLKWPNDLWLGPLAQARKLGGILIETVVLSGSAQSARYVVIGVGINIQVPQVADLRMPAAGWAEVQPHASPDSVLNDVLLPLVANVQRLPARVLRLCKRLSPNVTCCTGKRCVCPMAWKALARVWTPKACCKSTPRKDESLFQAMRSVCAWEPWREALGFSTLLGFVAAQCVVLGLDWRVPSTPGLGPDRPA